LLCRRGRVEKAILRFLHCGTTLQQALRLKTRPVHAIEDDNPHQEIGSGREHEKPTYARTKHSKPGARLSRASAVNSGPAASIRCRQTGSCIALRAFAIPREPPFFANAARRNERRQRQLVCWYPRWSDPGICRIAALPTQWCCVTPSCTFVHRVRQSINRTPR
jgi:hypothetical protein